MWPPKTDIDVPSDLCRFAYEQITITRASEREAQMSRRFELSLVVTPLTTSCGGSEPTQGLISTRKTSFYAGNATSTFMIDVFRSIARKSLLCQMSDVLKYCCKIWRLTKQVFFRKQMCICAVATVWRGCRNFESCTWQLPRSGWRAFR